MIRHLAASIVFSLAMIAPAAASDLLVATEHAHVVRLPADASVVVVGNPSIADAMIHDGRTLILTGRLQGRTNVIALDRVGRTIYSQEIVVGSPVDGQVALFRGPDRFTLSCGETCDEVPRTGDDAGRADALSQQQQDRLSAANVALGDDGGE